VSPKESRHTSATLRFGLRLLIKHPTLAAEEITSILGLAPIMANSIGTRRETPAGTVLNGRHQLTTCGHSVRFDGDRRFFSPVIKLIESLEPHSAFLSNIVDTGGSVELIIELSGNKNIGDTLQNSQLARLAKLGVALGIEVFPEF